MMKKMLLAAMVAGGLTVGLVLAQDKPVPTPPPPTTMPATGPACPMHDEVLKNLDDATKAVESGDKAAALAAIQKVRDMVQKCPMMKGGHCRMHCPMGGPKGTTQPAGFVNTKCPIMGGDVDPSKVTPALTREYKGMKIAFCCDTCPAQWDKLSDEEKDKKLKEVMPVKMPEPLPAEGHGEGHGHGH